MYILVDQRIPEKAKDLLAKEGCLLQLSTENKVYPEISGHPDIFCFQKGKNFIVAPFLQEQGFFPTKQNILKGTSDPGGAYPYSAGYNAVCTRSFLIHNPRITDPFILESCSDLEIIPVKQGYCRCNLVPLNDFSFICSDLGITKTLRNKGFNVFYVDPSPILLEGFQHGFLGGCIGIIEKRLYVLGGLSSLKESKELKCFIQKESFEIIELFKGSLFDGGSIFFID